MPRLSVSKARSEGKFKSHKLLVELPELHTIKVLRHGHWFSQVLNIQFMQCSAESEKLYNLTGKVRKIHAPKTYSLIFEIEKCIRGTDLYEDKRLLGSNFWYLPCISR